MGEKFDPHKAGEAWKPSGDELKLAMVIDDYKLKNKEEWWRQSLARKPEIERDYDLVREEICRGVTANTTSCIRYYRRKKGDSNG